MTKKQYAQCEEYWKHVKELPQFDTLVKASQLLNDGGYWGPEAESHIAPEDLNIEALKVQMKLFLKRYGEDIDPNDVSSDSFKDLVARVMNEKRGKPAGGSSASVPTEEIVHFSDSGK